MEGLPKFHHGYEKLSRWQQFSMADGVPDNENINRIELYTIIREQNPRNSLF
jgi:hypothetical protein